MSRPKGSKNKDKPVKNNPESKVPIDNKTSPETPLISNQSSQIDEAIDNLKASIPIETPETKKETRGRTKKSEIYFKTLQVQYQLLNQVLIKIHPDLAFTDIETTILIQTANELLTVYGLDIVKYLAVGGFIMSHVAIIGLRIPLAVKKIKEKRAKNKPKEINKK